MSDISTKFFADKAVGALWDVAVSIKRGNPLPLDKDAVVHNLTELEALKTSPVTYPGQIVAVICDAVLDENDVVVTPETTTLYYFDHNLEYHEVGKIPTGDDKTIEVGADGAISLLGAAGAANGTLPMLDSETGKLVWKTLEQIGAGDGNDNTTYEFSFANEKISITPKFNGVAQEAIELDLSSFVTADELAEAIAAIPEDTNTEYHLEYDSENKEIKLVVGADADKMTIDATPFIKDGMIESVELVDYQGSEDDKAKKYLKITWNIDDALIADDDEAKDVTYVPVDELVDVYTGVTSELVNVYVKNNKISADLCLESIDDAFLAPSVKERLNKQWQEVGDYATSDELADSISGLADVYATKDELSAVETTANNASTAVGNLEARFDEIVAVGGEPNAINKIQVNGSELAITNKTVNIEVPTNFSDLTDDSGFDERITSAKEQADKGVEEAGKANAAAANNAEEIGKHNTRISALETAKNEQANKILALENADAAHAGEFSALTEIVEGHTKTIAGLATTAALSEVSGKVATNENAIAAINETIPTIIEALGDKPDSKDVYKKTEIGLIEEGKTLIDMIDEAKSEATYDDTEVRGLISANTGAIAAIYNKDGENAATGVLVTEIARVEGLITAETERATGIEEDHEGRIAKMETFWKAADDPEGTIDKLAEIVAYIENDKSGALDMAEAIANNTEAIADIYTPGDGEIPASGVLVTEIARVEKKADDNATAIAAINNADTGILALANNYTDTQIAAIPAATSDVLGLIKYDNTSIKKNDNNQLYVAKVSTDNLEQGSQILVLNGGSAKE